MSAPILRRSAALVLAASLVPAAASAQLPSPSAASLGLGENVTAAARGFSALAWNPAGLAMPGTRGFSIAILPLHASAGMGPIGLSDLSEWQDQVMPDAVKSQWLARIRSHGSQQGSGGLDATVLALNVGRFGFQFSTMTHAIMDLAPAAAEVLLFGNVGESGQLQDFDFAGSALEVGVFSTVAAGWAQPFRLPLGPLPDQHFAVGATVKYTLGHALIYGHDMGSRLQGDPLAIELDFPVIMPDEEDYQGVVGSGLSLDIGAMWRGGPFMGGVAIRNLINGFSWDESRLGFIPFRATLDSETENGDQEIDTELRPLSEAPAELRRRVGELGFAPTLAIGGAFRPMPMLTLSADLRREIGDALRVGPRTHVGVGAEFRPVQVLPLRAGLSLVSGGYQISGGIGLEAGPLTMNAAAAHRDSDFGSGGRFMFTLGFGAR